MDQNTKGIFLYVKTYKNMILILKTFWTTSPDFHSEIAVFSFTFVYQMSVLPKTNLC